jgi:hypothetical protein
LPFLWSKKPIKNRGRAYYFPPRPPPGGAGGGGGGAGPAVRAGWAFLNVGRPDGARRGCLLYSTKKPQTHAEESHGAIDRKRGVKTPTKA